MKLFMRTIAGFAAAMVAGLSLLGCSGGGGEDGSSGNSINLQSAYCSEDDFNAAKVKILLLGTMAGHLVEIVPQTVSDSGAVIGTVTIGAGEGTRAIYTGVEMTYTTPSGDQGLLVMNFGPASTYGSSVMDQEGWVAFLCTTDPKNITSAAPTGGGAALTVTLSLNLTLGATKAAIGSYAVTPDDKYLASVPFKKYYPNGNIEWEVDGSGAQVMPWVRTYLGSGSFSFISK